MMKNNKGDFRGSSLCEHWDPDRQRWSTRGMVLQSIQITPARGDSNPGLALSCVSTHMYVMQSCCRDAFSYMMLAHVSVCDFRTDMQVVDVESFVPATNNIDFATDIALLAGWWCVHHHGNYSGAVPGELDSIRCTILTSITVLLFQTMGKTIGWWSSSSALH